MSYYSLAAVALAWSSILCLTSQSVKAQSAFQQGSSLNRAYDTAKESMCSSVSTAPFKWDDPQLTNTFSWNDPTTYRKLYYYTSETNSNISAEFNLFSCVAGSSNDKLQLLVPSGWPLAFKIEGVYACEPGTQSIPIVCTKKIETSINFTSNSKITFTFNSPLLPGSIVSIKFNGVNPVKKGNYTFSLLRVSGEKPKTGPANREDYVGSYMIFID